MKIRLTAAASALAAASIALASPLTPEQALQLVAAQRPAGMPAAPGMAMRHVLTIDMPSQAEPAIYVFAREAAPGYVVTAADDNCPALILGYSSDAPFDAASLPPALQEWLQASAHAVAAYAEAPTAAAPSYAESDQPDVAPLCSTKWNQDAPYNNKCPMVNNRRSVTGCMATAMAQVMKKHDYPIQGEGSHTYSFEAGAGKQLATANFGKTTYDWANMLDTYPSTATNAQKNAVAVLMYHCGVACDMQYSPSASGAYLDDAALGMIEYFTYDKSMMLLGRDWYTAAEWDKIIYAEIAAGRPVLYTGYTSKSEGHAFVCDGYQQGGYYHFNWGWGGSCDGYYTLANLNPEEQGIGGGSAGYAFNYYQTVAVNVQPDMGTEHIAPLLYMPSAITVKYGDYQRTRMSQIQFAGPYYNGSLAAYNYTMASRSWAKASCNTLNPRQA